MGRRSAHEVMEVSDDRALHLQWFVSLNILNEILDSLCFRASCILHSFIHQLHCWTILQYTGLFKGNPIPPGDCGLYGLRIAGHFPCACWNSPGYFVWWLWHRSLCLNWKSRKASQWDSMLTSCKANCVPYPNHCTFFPQELQQKRSCAF